MAEHKKSIGFEELIAHFEELEDARSEINRKHPLGMSQRREVRMLTRHKCRAHDARSRRRCGNAGGRSSDDAAANATAARAPCATRATPRAVWA